ncbi:hypothetical protein RBB78_20200 [Tunturiibacter empetritectus]
MKLTTKLLLIATLLIAGTCATPTPAAAQPGYGGPPRELPAPPTTAAETGAISGRLATSAWSARSAAPPAFATAPGASIVVASGSTEAAAPSSSSAAQVHHLRRLDQAPVLSSPAPPTTEAEDGVT